ncbi:DUF2470 domain-containing protein [Streptomyces albipurpureus]|uniref:DUF2470 domain-containing protein n=1 Tax=Streptomyces albipurpureus TaxID=2897419 RepID=A0ABT0UNE1_9ACTN|nr:DUF2470 domain-containing protein [Streptomyces sp. CWNU-1]MCM2389851.1 DUF2470 domain-containing protein [Streptomyces sp. CWNU-1]
MRRLFNAPLAQPTSAERIRSILTAADSMTVVTDEGRTEVSRLGGPGISEHVHLHPAPTRVRESATAVPGDGPVRATLEFTDIAPTPVRDRVRARVLLVGWLVDSAEHSTPQGSRCMQFDHAVLDRDGERVTVSLDELMEADTDPLATCEAGMLTHLLDDHGDIVDLLLRLVKPRLTLGARRALPVAIDRYGITLRLEYADTYADARLPFPAPVKEVDQAGVRIHSLLNMARHRTPRSWLLSDS